MTEIVPAILPKDAHDLREKISRIPHGIPLIHIDILEEDIWTDTEKEFEVHIMAKEPEELALLWASREAFSVIVHKITDNILNVRKNSKLGLGVEIHIPLDDITGDVSKVDFLHLMSISEMGAQGRPFEPKIFDRIREVKEKFPDMSISVDGGINKDNFEELGKAGVSKAIVGSAFEELWQSLQMKK